VFENGDEDNIWAKEGWSDGRLEETTPQGTLGFVLFTKYN
jgi:hypothetical protein